MFNKKKVQPAEVHELAAGSVDERTERALQAILSLADLITPENQRDGDLQNKIAINVKGYLQDIYGRFSSSKRLKGIYENIYSITTFPNDQLRFHLLNFYYTALDLFNKTKAKKEVSEEETK